MKKIILFLFVIATSINVFAQSTLITPGNQENRNIAPDLILTSTNIPELRGQRSAGTLALPTAALNGATLLQLNGYGYDGTHFVRGAQISYNTRETWTSTANGAEIRFATTQTGTTNFSEKMRLTGDGYLGIGTNSPARKLHIFDGTSGVTSTSLAPLFIENNSSCYVHLGSPETSASGILFGKPSNQFSGGIIYDGSNNLSLRTGGNSVRVLVSSTGKVGIGSVTPTGKLHIEHSGTDADPHLRLHSTASAARINWSTTTNGNVWTAQSYLESDIPASNYWRLEYNSATRFYIAGNGNVGIGTITPDNKLDVLGTIRGNEVIVETGWADYVFKNDYKLKPLSEVENFIKTNQHLPNVPSAANIQEKGAHVAELMTKMMEKIEELTLYTINQQKEIDELKQRLDEKK